MLHPILHLIGLGDAAGLAVLVVHVTRVELIAKRHRITAALRGKAQ